MKNYCRIFSAAMLAALAVSCSDNLADNDHYKTPDWLKGSAYEVLQKEGNYSIFLKGLELTGNDGVAKGKSLLTVAAPDDEAFTAFLSEKGYGSIEDLYQANPQYVKNLIGIHLMYYAYNWDKMVNFRPSDGDAATEEDKVVNAGLYYKHRTHSQDAVENISAVVDGQQSDIKIYHYERYLPVFSTKFFTTKGIADAAADYNYFYPQTEWYGTAHSGDGFNIANAAVKDEDNVITDNGYLYHIDRVIEPVNTIYDELKNNTEYSQFFNLYNSYLTYTSCLDETNTTLGYVAYMRSHGSLPPIAYEWTISSNTSQAYSQTAALESRGYSIFAPTNAALNSFFNTFWTAENGYPDIESLDPLIKQYFVYQLFAQSNYPVMPTEIKNGKVKTYYGTTVNFNPDEIGQNLRKVCCNGVLYGMSQMTAPAIFSSVAAPAFKDVNYNCYLYALDGSGLTSSLAADNSEFVTLIPSNAQFEAADPQMRLYTLNSGKELQEYSSDAGAFVAIGNTAKLNLVNMHVSDNVSSLPTSGTKVISTYAPFNYWFVKDGTITTNALFNEQLEPTYAKETPFVAFHEIDNNGSAWNNGKAYSYDAASIFKQVSGDGMLYKLATCNDSRFDYYIFAQLLSKAGLVQAGSIVFPTDEGSTDRRLIAFIPTNEAIKANYKSIPGYSRLFDAKGNFKASGTVTGTTKAELQSWLTDYFISNEENQFTDYPFIGSSCTGTFITKTLTNNLAINDNGSSMSVRLVGSDKTVALSAKYDYFPFAFSDGCIQFIDGLLK